MRYYDKKWHVEIDEKGETDIKVHCECGNIHDIHLDNKGRFIARGTFLGGKRKIYMGQVSVKLQQGKLVAK